MSDAFKCDRCGTFEEGSGATLKHLGDHKVDDGYEKELCEGCYVGWVQYVTGTEVETIEGYNPPEPDERHQGDTDA